MPITWLNKNRSALALSIFFPWFPPMPVSPPAEPPAVAVEAAVSAEEPLVLPGVVIEEIPKGSALEKAGLQVGDVVLSWERLPNPPANPEGARGELGSYFDWVEFEEEQVPRGAVVLRGRRGADSLELSVELGVWEVEVRPVLTQTLEAIYSTGKSRLLAGDIKAAVQEWQSIAYLARDKGDSGLYAWTTLMIGDYWGEKVEWREAIDTYQRALSDNLSPLAKITIMDALGAAQMKRNAYQDAEEVYASVLELRRKLSQESLGVAKGLNWLGKVAWARRDLDRAFDLEFQALKIKERHAPHSLEMAASLNNLASLAWSRGDVDRAYEYQQKALIIKETVAPESFSVSISLTNLAAFAWARGDLDFARASIERALRLQRQHAPQSLMLATSLSNLGMMARTVGDLDHAHAFLMEALVIQEQLVPGGFETGTTLNNLGAVAWARRDLGRAHSYLLKALQVQERIAPNSIELATCLNNLGVVAREERELVYARRYLLRALAVLDQVAPESLNAATTLTNLGDVALDKEELAHAFGYYSRALQIQQKIAPQSLGVAISFNNLGNVFRARSNFDRAEEYYNRALQIHEHVAPNSLDVATSLKNLGDVAQSRADLDRARTYYIRTLEALEHQVSRLGGSYAVQAGFRAQHRDYYHATLKLLVARLRLSEAFHVLERFRAQTFLAMLAERDTTFTVDIPEEVERERRLLGIKYDRTLKELAGLNPRDNVEEIEKARNELQRLTEEAEDIEARIRQVSPRLASLKYPQPLTAAGTRQALDPGMLLLSYSVGKEETTLFALSHLGDLEVKILPLGEDALRSRVKQMLGLISEVRAGSSIASSIGKQRQLQLQNASRELFTLLLGPVADQIASSERLLILPDGPLHALPFGALMRDDGADGQYLAEWKPIHVALSATVFAELKQRRRSTIDSGPVQLAAFGDPVYPQSLTRSDRSSSDPIVRSAAERGIFDWQPLPYTRREVEGIASLFPAGTTRIFLGPEALEERIKSLDPKTRILHLAAHGHTDEHLPSSSFVALTIPEDTKPDDTRDNGLLQVWEIFERVRIDADLVVLSACDTGLGKELGGEGLIGLTRAFQYAGARTVMASLWSIQDQATSELMIRFYKHLRAGLPKDEALRQAQMELIRGPIEVVNEKGEKTLFDASAPYYWAGIQVYGDWQ